MVVDILVMGTDGDSQGKVKHCVSRFDFNYGFWLSDLLVPLHEVMPQSRVMNSGFKVMLIACAYCK